MTRKSRHIYIRVQPAGPNPNAPGAHWSQRRPITFGLHSHWPPIGSQFELYEPVRSHEHSASTTIHYYYYNRFTALWILSGTTRVSRYQKGKTKTNLDFLEQETMVQILWSPEIPHNVAHMHRHRPTKEKNKQNKHCFMTYTFSVLSLPSCLQCYNHT